MEKSPLMNKSANNDAGFTLLEVLVSLAILAVTTGVLLSVFSNGLRLSHKAEMESYAVMEAQSVLARLGADLPLEDGDITGQTENGFHWKLHIEPYGDARDRMAWPVKAKAVSASVFWTEGGQEKTVALDTIRIFPKAPLQ